MSDKDFVEEAQEQLKASDDAFQDVRDAYLDDVRFARLGEQWPDWAKRQRELEKRPCLTVNRLPSFIRQVVNDARQNKPQIKIKPVDNFSDVKTAETINGLIRNIEYSSNADVAYDTGIENAVSGGFGFIQVMVDYAHDDTFDLDLMIDRVGNPLTVHPDPASTAADSSDWRFCIVTEQMTRKEFEKKYPDAEVVEFKDVKGDDERLWWDEEHVTIATQWNRTEVMRPIVKLSDGRVLSADVYKGMADFLTPAGIYVVGERATRSYEVACRILSGKEMLETREWQGRYIPIIPVYGEEVNVEGKRYFKSLVRDARDPQSMFNFWRTATTELVALAPKAPWIGPEGAFGANPEKWASANVASHSFLEYRGNVMPQRTPFAGVPAGALQEALNASDDLKSVMGIFDASLGARSNETSGVAIRARQREGDVGTFHFIDNLARAIKHTGRVLVDMIPHVYNSERVIRTIGADGKSNAITINTAGTFDLTTGKYDVAVDVGPGYTTKREEAVYSMTELARAAPQLAPIMADLIAENMDWPGADRLSKRLKAMLPPPVAQADSDQSDMPPQAIAMMTGAQQQMQQMQQQMQAAMQKFQQLQNENQQLQMQLQAEKNNKDVEMVKADTEKTVAMANRDIKLRELGVREVEAQAKLLSGVPTGMVGVPDLNNGTPNVEQPQQGKPIVVVQPPKRRKVSIQAPSGKVYQGQISDE